MDAALSEDLTRIVNDIEDALSKREAVRFNRLLTKRKKLIRSLFTDNDVLELPHDVILELADQNRRWLERGKQVMSDFQARLGTLNRQSRASSEINRSYSGHTASGKYLSQDG